MADAPDLRLERLASWRARGHCAFIPGEVIDLARSVPSAYASRVPALILGPMLRYVGEECAHIWVETDSPCQVEVLGATAPTFHVAGHHYALVRIDGLANNEVYEYEVHLDGDKVWPDPASEYPPSRFRTYPKGEELQVVFGSCRVAAPNEEPHNLSKDDDPEGREVDALRGLAKRMLDQPFEDWPELLLMLGDQVYADETSPKTKEFIRSRRTVDGPAGEDVLDFEEYTQLYRESWSEPPIRWLLSTVSTAMIFDDHDVHDDWNISATWLDQMRTGPLWDEHIIGALMSYWVYQHIGNLRPRALDEDELFSRVHAVDDAGPLLRDFAMKADREPTGTRWSFYRDLGDTRLVVIDSRAGRVLDPGARSMLDQTGVELAGGDGHRRVRPPAAGHLAALAADARPARPRGLERGRLRRRLGQARRLGGREGAPGRRPRALGRVSRVVHAAGRAAAGGGRR